MGIGSNRRAPRAAIGIALVLIIVIAVSYALLRRARLGGWEALREIRATSDEGHVYLLIRTEGKGQPDWDRIAYRIAIDTYDPKRGERTLPKPFPAQVPTGAEFLIDIQGPEKTWIKATPTYNPYPNGKMVEGRPVSSPQKPSGVFEPLRFESNRERFGRDGKRFPAQMVNRGKLRFLRPGEDARRALQADIATGADGTIELRIPWSLLNVGDPSSRHVLHGIARAEESETIETAGFRFYAYAFDARRPGEKARTELPGSWRSAPLYTWPTWDEPKYRIELKESAEIIGKTMKELTDVQPR